jgi:hypothetical protein
MLAMQNGLLGTPETYGGLLDGQQQSQARNNGLMNFGASLLASSGPSATPQSFGRNFGQAALQGRSAQSQSTQDAINAALLKKQLTTEKYQPPEDVVQVIGEDGKPRWMKKSDAVGQLSYNNQPSGKGIPGLNDVDTGKFTPASLKAYAATIDPATGMGDYGLLVERVSPVNPVIVQTPAGVEVVQPTRGGGIGGRSTVVSGPNLQTATEAEAAAKARGGAVGKGEGERTADAPTNIRKADTLISQTSGVIDEIDKALVGASGFGTTGLTGKATAIVPGTGSYDLGATLKTVKANLGFDRLQAMRDASPTGGALGQVAVQELESLQATIASLDQFQSKEQLLANLEKVKTHYKNWQGVMRQYKEQNQELTGQKGAPSRVVNFEDLP